MIFVTFSVAEVARGMWNYRTLAYAVREGTRYAIVHGSDCSTSPNSCLAAIANIATKIQTAGIGLDQNKPNLTFTPNTGAATTCLLVNCLTDVTAVHGQLAGDVSNDTIIERRWLERRRGRRRLLSEEE